MSKSLYKAMASTLEAMRNCIKSGNEEWQFKHGKRLSSMERDYLPSGGGFDNGTHLDWVESTPEKLIFTTSFHFMNENGYYDGWYDYKVIVTASLAHDLNIRIVGKDRDGIKDYIADVFYALAHNQVEAGAGYPEP